MVEHILIIDDEKAIADNIIYALESDGFRCSWTPLAQDGLDKLTTDSSINLLILDIGLPDINGFELCKIIRQQSTMPIIFLTARSEEIDRIIGLEIGADDYVVKPFSPRELSARVKVILKRIKTQTPQTTATEDNSLFTIDNDKRQIHFNGKLLNLTRYEYDILYTLLQYPDRVYTRQQLMDHVWEVPETRIDRAVDTHIKSLRAKLRSVRNNFDPITTHRGVGYSIRIQADDPES